MGKHSAVVPEVATDHATSQQPSGAGILKADTKKAGRALGTRSVRWRTVLVADAEHSGLAAGSMDEPTARKNPCTALALALRDLRLWLLTYETVMIPIRFSLTDLVVTSIVCTVLDILVDLCEIMLNETIAVRSNLPLLIAIQNNRALPVASEDKEAHAANYSSRRLLIDIPTIALLHCGRASYVLFGVREIFVYAQIFRSSRVLDLSAHLQAMNSNLATNVTFLSIFKFTLILLSVPHWCACFWIVAADGWGNGDKDVELPSWPAQFELYTGNPALDANKLSFGERYLLAAFMSYSGLAAFGYSVRLAVRMPLSPAQRRPRCSLVRGHSKRIHSLCDWLQSGPTLRPLYPRFHPRRAAKAPIIWPLRALHGSPLPALPTDLFPVRVRTSALRPAAAPAPQMVLTNVDEVVLAFALSLAQIVFYSYVLGTLFHYLVRTDENTVAFKGLIKAVEEFAVDRSLPAPLVSRIVAHFRFQHSKQSSATDRIFAQMPKTLQIVRARAAASTRASAKRQHVAYLVCSTVQCGLGQSQPL